jgi:hypothetical protein
VDDDDSLVERDILLKGSSTEDICRTSVTQRAMYFSSTQEARLQAIGSIEHCSDCTISHSKALQQ